MKSILILMVAFSWPALAAQNFQGCYKKQPNIDILQVVDYQWVWVGNKAGQAKLKEWQDQGYTCVRKPANRALCKKVVENSFVDKGDVEGRMQSAPNELCFAPTDLEPKLISESDSLKVWKYPQVLFIDLERVEDFYLYQLTTIDKIRFDAHGESYEFISEFDPNGKRLFSKVQVIRIKGKDSYTSALVSNRYQ
ncbi:MAG: hypothetical protein KDD33_12740 [Bdellovibrionales bacterium]|nr:hypothetical protein [Bdellovibrionales bacterium]